MNLRCVTLIFLCLFAPTIVCAGDVLGQLQEIEEDLSGDSDFSKWTEPACRFRRLVTLVAGPGDRPALVSVNGLAIRKLRQGGQLGAGLLARTAGGEKLASFYDVKNDLFFVQLLAQHRKRDDVTLSLYYGAAGEENLPTAPQTNLVDAAIKGYTTFLWPEETSDKVGDSAIVLQSIERYRRLSLVEPAQYTKALPIAEANCGTVERFADHPKGIKFAPFTAASGPQLVRIRWHSSAPITARTTVTFTPKTAAAQANPIAPVTQTFDVQGHGFFWSEAVVTLPAATLTPTVTVSSETDAKLGIDFISLSPDMNWRPDYDSLSGPLWIRFRLPVGAAPVESIALTASHTTYSVNGILSDPDGVWMPNFWFKLPGLQKLAPKRLVKPTLEANRWSPWGQLHDRGSFTWFETLLLQGPVGMKQKSVEIQLAFKPYECDVFRQETLACDNNRAKFRMPMTPNDFADAYRFAKGYASLIRDRIASAESLGLDEKHQLKKLAFSVFQIEDDVTGLDDLTISLFKRIGFNGVDVPNPKIPAIYEKYNFTEHLDHSWVWDFIETDYAALAGQTYAEKMDAYRKNVVANIRKMHVRQFPDDAPYNILGDEIGPAVSDYSLHDRGLESLFILWLTEQNVTPEFFGVKHWSDFRWPVAPLGLAAASKARQAEFDRLAKEALKKADEEAKKGPRPPVGEIGLDEADDEKIKQQKELLEKTGDKKAMTEALHKRAQDNSPIVPEPKSLEGRRLRYYMRRFQSDFTGRVYNAFAEGFYKESKNPKRTVSGPNFQADPAQHGQMWDGGLDLFVYGRTAGVHSMIQIEDWVGPSAYMNCAFAGAIIRAACRTSNAVPSCLITGGRARPKIIGWLSQGIRKFDSYTYGPLYCIGPVYADDPVSIENIGHTLAEMSRVEDDILACKPDNKIAMLVANTSEVIVKNSGHRIRMFSDATLAGFGVDVISEDDVILDKLHERYGVVLLADQGVRREVQETLAKWIGAGGRVLMSTGSAAFDQFEEPCDLLAKSAAKNCVLPIETPDERIAFQHALKREAAAAKIIPTFTSNSDTLAVWSAKGENRQVLYVIRSAGEKNEVTITISRAAAPKSVFSAKRGVIPSKFDNGQLSFELSLPPAMEDATIAEMPNTDIVVIRD